MIADKAARRGTWIAATMGLGLLCSSVLAYYRMFTGFAEWDDEGTLMISVRQFLDGGRLYDNVRSYYGPVYYFFNWALRRLSFSPVTHDVTRLTSAVMWTIGAALGAWLVWRVGRSKTVAAVAYLVIFPTLYFFNNEPGHPQELCLLLVLGLAATGLVIEEASGEGWLPPALSGGLLAALLLVKVNSGIFAIAAMGLAVLLHLPSSGAVRVLRWVFGALGLLFPYILMRSHLDDPGEQAYCAAVTAGIAAVLLAPRPFPNGSWRFCLRIAAAFTATCALVLLILTSLGTSVGQMVSSIVLGPIGFYVGERRWFIAPNLDPWWILWAAAAPVTALLAKRWLVERRPRVLVAVLIGFGAVVLLLAWVSSGQILGFATPFCWLVMFPPNQERHGITRTLIAATATLQTLYAFPIAGSQILFVRVLLIVCGSICLADGLHGLAPGVVRSAFARAAGTATIVMIAAGYPMQVWRAREVYNARVPLKLPGAERVRARADQVAAYRWMVGLLKQNCDTFVGYPGLPSLYFWTAKPMPGPAEKAPGPLNLDAWIVTYSAEEQSAVVEEFQQHANGCVVYYPSGVAFWNRSGADLSGQPLVHFIQTHFRTVAKMGEYEFRVRNERHDETLTLR